MYMVTPSVYQKMLNCISDKDKIVTENLNEPVKEDEKTTADKIVEGISHQDFSEQPQLVEPPNIVEEQKPVVSNPTDAIFSNPNSDEYWEDDPQPLVGNYPPQELVYSNPLKTPCSQNYSEGQLAPSVKEPTMAMVDMNPRVVMRKSDIVNMNPRVELQRLQVVAPEITQKPGTQMVDMNPRVVMRKSDIVNMNPKVSLKRLQVLSPEITKKPQIRKGPFQCDICFRNFTRNWDLKRHMNSSTVHANMKTQPTQQQVIDNDLTMQELNPTNVEQQIPQSFDNWSTGITTRSGKKYVPMDTSRPSLRGKRSATVAKLGKLHIPSKSRPPGGNEQESFEHWS